SFDEFTYVRRCLFEYERYHRKLRSLKQCPIDSNNSRLVDFLLEKEAFIGNFVQKWVCQIHSNIWNSDNPKPSDVYKYLPKIGNPYFSAVVISWVSEYTSDAKTRYREIENLLKRVK